MLSPETYCRLVKNGARHAWTNVFQAETEAKLTQGKPIKTLYIQCIVIFNRFCYLFEIKENTCIITNAIP